MDSVKPLIVGTAVAGIAAGCVGVASAQSIMATPENATQQLAQVLDTDEPAAPGHTTLAVGHGSAIVAEVFDIGDVPVTPGHMQL